MTIQDLIVAADKAIDDEDEEENRQKIQFDTKVYLIINGI